jgi:hypothetical protein
MSGAPLSQFVVLACDESGSKGYADRDEQTVGEVGVFAGIMVPGELLAGAQAQFDVIAKKYETAPGKVHITDLTPVQQGQLRKEMYDAIEQLKLPCFFEATHVAGFHAYYRMEEALVERAKAQRRSPIKLSGKARNQARFTKLCFSGCMQSCWPSALSEGRRSCISKCAPIKSMLRSSIISKPPQRAYWTAAHKLRL